MQSKSFMPLETDVLIVGFGPVGAALANLLALHGVAITVIEKSQEIFNAPRAIALDNEALRILQMCGLQENDLDTVAIPEVKMHSPHFGLFNRAITAGAIDGHPKLVTFYQPQLERVLRRKLQMKECVQIRLGVEMLSFDQTKQGVTTRVKTEDGCEYTIQSKFIVGADGANSLVRRLLGEDFRGKTFPEDWLVVDAKRVQTPIDHVEFNCNPSRPTPHMAAPGERERWEFKLQPGETREQMEHPDTVRRLLKPWTQGQEPEIERVAVYRFHARVANTFQCNRAFLVGDAAHITPPFVGQGLVAGLRDVANLAWKLAWVLQMRARPDLLDSYTQERQPHVKAMINMALHMGKLVMPSNQWIAFLVHGLMKSLNKIPRMRRRFENLENKPINRFKVGCFVHDFKNGKLNAGGQAPQAWLRNRRTGDIKLSDDALGQGFVMVGFGVDPTLGLSPEQHALWRRLGGDFSQINPRGGHDTDSKVRTWEDMSGLLIPTPVPMGWIAIIRPDKTLMSEGPAANAVELLNKSIKLFAPNRIV